MNLFDNEKRIIEMFQKYKIFKTWYSPINIQTIRIFKSIYLKCGWKHWVDTSAKNMPPPDFYNDKLMLMMDVMRIDDHSFVDKNNKVINLHNKRESEVFQELISRNKSILEAAKKGNVFINPMHYKFGEEDHNYGLYIKNFNRVISNHIEKIEKYKKNHNGFKIIFFVFDESTSYMKCGKNKRPKIPGELFTGELHYWWKDENFLKIIKNTEIDYIIWMTPYKIYDTTRKALMSSIQIIDVKKYKYKNTIEYNIDDMQSSEL